MSWRSESSWHRAALLPQFPDAAFTCCAWLLLLTLACTFYWHDVDTSKWGNVVLAIVTAPSGGCQADEAGSQSATDDPGAYGPNHGPSAGGQDRGWPHVRFCTPIWPYVLCV